jgi:hypothetical protein
VRLKSLGVLQQHRAKSAALGVGIYIQVVEPPRRETGEAHRPATELDYPDFMPGGDPAAKLGAVAYGDARQVRHRIPRPDEDAADCICVGGRPWADHGGFRLSFTGSA